MQGSTALTLLALTMVPSPASAQQRPWGPLARPGLVDSVGPLRTEQIPRTIEDAEREGAEWPQITAAPTQPVRGRDTTVMFTVPGPRTCTVGKELGPARSGEFLIGAQLSGSVAGTHGNLTKIWWRPDHPALEYDLLVRGRSLTNSADTMRMVFTDWAHVGGESWFFPSGTIFPTAGRWLVIASHGPNWGCFILESR